MIPQTRFHRLLEAKIEEAVKNRMEELAQGVVDYPTYRQCIGEISGLRGALRLCDDIERDLDERFSESPSGR